MKKLLWVMLSLFAFRVGIGFAADFNVQTGFYYDWWEDNKENKGSQAFVPVRIDARYHDFSLSFLTGYAYTRFDGIPLSMFGSDNRDFRESLAHLLDTKINLSYEIVGKLPVDVLVGLDFNLPSGKTKLNQKRLAVVMDPDLVSITKFGEGFNINPTVTVAKEWGNLVAGIGAGYVWRGEYDYDFSVVTNPFPPFGIQNRFLDYSPGDIFTLNAEIRYYFSSDWRGRLFGNYTWYGEDKADAVKFYQEGQFFLLGVGLLYKQPKWETEFTFRGIFRDKSKFQETANGIFFPIPVGLSTESHNIHGDEWIGDLTLKYFLNDKITLRSFLQGLLITRNNYSSDSRFFIGSREKVSLGFEASRVFGPQIEAGLLAKGFFMHDEERNFPEPRSARNYAGFSIGLQLRARF